MTTVNAPTMRVVTMYGIDGIAITSSASISSLMRCAPSCEVNLQPIWDAIATAAMIGAISRVLP